MAQTENTTGSIADISNRLALWARRSTRGLVRVEYSSEFARQQVIGRLKTTLADLQLPFDEITLPTYQLADALVAELLTQLSQAQPGVVSVVGFATAFNRQVPLADALRVLNFNRERLIAFPLLQIWWVTPAFLQTAIHAMPDLNSWFSQRLQLTEVVLPEAVALASLQPERSTTHINDARQRAYQLLHRFETARKAGAPDLDLLNIYLLPALKALAEVGAQQELRDLTSQFEGLLGRLKITDAANLAASLNRLAKLYHEQGRYAEAEPLYQRALAIREQQLGADHPATAQSLNNLAELYRVTGRYAEAEPLYQRALTITEQQLGADHPDTATSLNNLAALYRATGRYAEAEPLYQRALAIREQQLGADHPDTAQSLNNLAELYRATGRYAEAEPLYQRALTITEQQLGADHPDTATSLNNLAELYRVTGRYAEAEPLYQRSLAIREQQLGADHPDTAISLNNLAILYRTTGRYAEAEPLYQRALAIREQQLGADHPDTATSLNNLAELYRVTGRYAEAEPLLLRSLAINQKTLGDRHPRTRSGVDNLRSLVQDALQSGRARELSDHPLTQTILRELTSERNDE